MKFQRITIDWIGHDDGSTAVAIREPQGWYDEDGMPWDVLHRDWEILK